MGTEAPARESKGHGALRQQVVEKSSGPGEKTGCAVELLGTSIQVTELRASPVK